MLISEIVSSSPARSRCALALAYGAALAGLLVSTETAAPQSQAKTPLDTLPASGTPYSSMHMVLEKTIFKVDVLMLEIRVAEADRRRIERLASGRRYSEELADSIADIGINSRDAMQESPSCVTSVWSSLSMEFAKTWGGSVMPASTTKPTSR
jgi:hypothetical protein